MLYFWGEILTSKTLQSLESYQRHWFRHVGNFSSSYLIQGFIQLDNRKWQGFIPGLLKVAARGVSFRQPFPRADGWIWRIPAPFLRSCHPICSKCVNIFFGGLAFGGHLFDEASTLRLATTSPFWMETMQVMPGMWSRRGGLAAFRVLGLLGPWNRKL